jgi:hypothetical protein
MMHGRWVWRSCAGYTLRSRLPSRWRQRPPQLLKVAEVAKRLGVSSDGVYTRIERGEISVVELGDTRKNQRVRESDLTAFIDRNTYGRGTAGRRGCCVDDREEGLVNGTAPDESLTPAQQRRRAQALDEAGQVISRKRSRSSRR